MRIKLEIDEIGPEVTTPILRSLIELGRAAFRYLEDEKSKEINAVFEKEVAKLEKLSNKE